MKAIRATLDCSEFFQTHEVIGSSLLFVHDSVQAGIWLIDFAKTVELPEKVEIDHNSAWTVGNHEDGYLIGINNMIDIFTELLEQNSNKSSSPLSTEKNPKESSSVGGELTSAMSSVSVSQNQNQGHNQLRASQSAPSIVKTNSTQQIVILDNSKPEERLENT